jgi:2-polyprenyl-6-methoxyphenol hydroxylase-like FAD-dependent oxidoreductase
MEVLAELGWLEDFLRRPHQQVERIRVHVGDEEIALVDFSHAPTQAKFAALMPQWDFLDFLVGKGDAFPGFELWLDADATELIYEDRRYCGVRGTRRGEGKSDSDFEVRADLVLATDGRHSTMRRQAGLPVRNIGAPMDVLWFRLSRLPTDSEQSIGWLKPGRFLVLIDRRDYWQVAYVIRKGAYAAVKERGIERLRDEVATCAPLLSDRVGELTSFDEVSFLEVKVDRLEEWWRPGLLCIGDAAHAMSPVGGVGINLAIQDAVAAANLLSGPLAAGKPADADLARVQRRRELPTRATQAIQVLVQNQLIGPVLADSERLHAGALLHLVDRVPFLQRIPAHLVGVGVLPEHVRTAQAPL